MRKSLTLFCLYILSMYSSFGSDITTVSYNTQHEHLNFSIVQLQRQLLDAGTKLFFADYRNKSNYDGLLVIVQGDETNLPNEISSQVNFDGIDNGGYRIQNIKGTKTILLISKNQEGAVYGMMDLWESIQSGMYPLEIQDRIFNPAFEYRIVKFNLPWSPYRESPATEIHTHISRDLSFWEKFLDMMVENRLNVLSLWNNHPFPFLIKSENFPKANSFSDTEMEEWQTFWKSLFRMAKLRGIQTFIINWNIVVSPEFAEAYGVNEYNDLSDIVKQYTRESVTQVIDEYEDLTGIGVTLADWMGNFGEMEMTPQTREDWIEDTFVAGMKDAKRPVKFIHRSVLAGDPIAMRNLLDRADLQDPALVEIKFNWSHGHSTPKLSITHDYHSGELDDRFWNPMPENYRIQWMVRNEDFFILRWGQPDFIREHIQENSKPYVNGYFIGSEGYIPAMDYSHVVSPIKTWQYAFEKQWMFYKTWGRLLYDPSTPDDYFDNELVKRYGKGVDSALLEAYKLSGNMPLRLASFYRSTWDYTLYSEGFIEAEPSSRSKWFDRSSPFISIDELIHHETLDPALISIIDYVESSKDGSKAPENRISPLKLADQSDEDSRKALTLINPLYELTNEYSGALVSELDDISTWSYLGLYFADKLRAGVALAEYRLTGNIQSKNEAVSLLEKCLMHWDQVIHFTSSRYLKTPHVSTQRYGDEFSGFSWEELRPQIVRDIEIAKNANPTND
jgi:hypothetical protein